MGVSKKSERGEIFKRSRALLYIGLFLEEPKIDKARLLRRALSTLGDL